MATAAPAPAPPSVGAAAAAAAGTKVTTTDYGHVIDELRRIALLTALMLAILVVLWLLLG